jgi:2-C-methyl-D-erythritol 4-phosphate cytidylyltransferase
VTKVETSAIVVAGGSGARFGGAVPKQFLDLDGKSVIRHCIDVLASSQFVDSIIVVLPEDVPEHISEELDLPTVTSMTTGGPTRQDSVSEGAMCLPSSTGSVMVHDGARPVLRESLLMRLNAALDEGVDGVVPALGLADAIKEVSSEGHIIRSRSKEGWLRVQTPQLFWRDPFEESLARAQAASLAADDCSEMLVEAGYRVGVVEGDPYNIKITRPADLTLCSRILEGGIQ